MNSEIIALKEPTGGGLSSPIFFNLRRKSIFGFWIFSEKYRRRRAEILHGGTFF